MTQVLGSAEARERFPHLIETLVEHTTEAVEVGRHRRREVVMISADRYDTIVEQNEMLNNLAWAAFAAERIDNPTSAPISWEEAQARRRRR
ncbi:MAG TPA: hypothetical protein VF533_06095 [Solirubrobacteraceae bacterium]|jgi:PHD/YefM family antitoxin component YafN of YafNO toxin-antitoxin module